jgi:WD40 repeat protein
VSGEAALTIKWEEATTKYWSRHVPKWHSEGILYQFHNRLHSCSFALGSGHLVTYGGDKGTVRVWDIRQTASPVATIGTGHSTCLVFACCFRVSVSVVVWRVALDCCAQKARVWFMRLGYLDCRGVLFLRRLIEACRRIASQRHKGNTKGESFYGEDLEIKTRPRGRYQ